MIKNEVRWLKLYHTAQLIDMTMDFFFLKYNMIAD